MDEALQVPAQRTPLEPSQALALISSALAAELGREPSAAELKILLAQTALETGRWRKMYNWNFGNSVAARGTPFFVLREPKVHHYRPFVSAWQGVTYYVALLRRRFTQAWAVLETTADPVAYAYALKAQHYYEAPAEAYARAMASLFREFGADNSPSSAAIASSRPAARSAAAHFVDPSKGRNEPARAGFGGAAVLLLAWYWLRSHQLRY